MPVRVEKNGFLLVEKLEIAKSFFARFKGLMGRATLEKGCGLYIRPCSSLHMFFMRFPIDAVFLDREMRVVAIEAEIRPWRVSGIHLDARSVLEIPQGLAAAAGLARGDRLLFEDIAI